MNWETYLALGDSITIGARSYLGYPEIAGATLEHKLAKQWNVINCAVSGYTAMDLGRLIDARCAHLQAQPPSITTILIGTNDIKAGTDLESFEIALTQIIVKAKILTQHANVVLIQIPLFQKGVMYPYNVSMNSAVEDFNRSILKLAENHNLKSLSLDLSEEDFFDGVHLNDKGSKNGGLQVANFILHERGLS